MNDYVLIFFEIIVYVYDVNYNYEKKKNYLVFIGNYYFIRVLVSLSFVFVMYKYYMEYMSFIILYF